MIDVLCKNIIEELKITCLIETGTDKAETVALASRWFAQWDPNFGTIVDSLNDGSRSYHAWNEAILYPVFTQVKTSPYQIHSVDLDKHSYQKARKIFQNNKNIHLHNGSSEQFLNEHLQPFIEKSEAMPNFLFFLDAHWGKYWPLRDELQVIQKLKKYAIVIDDFMVPGKSDPNEPHGEFGFDIYEDRILNWSYISDLFSQTDVRIFYPQEANRDHRGWVLITHGYTREELAFLDALALFEMDKDDRRHTASVRPTLRTYMDKRNLIKKVVPINVLRSINRVQEKLAHTCEQLFNANAKNGNQNGR